MIQKNKLKEYIHLTKPGIILGNLITCTSGFFLASKGDIDPALLFQTLIGLAFIIASGCVFNNYIDRKSDEKMERTKDRALVQGSISLKNARKLAIILFFLGCFVLIYFTNALALFAAMVGFIVYLFFYTLLKYKTSTATLIGSIAGAMPPVVGYVAKSSYLDIPCLLLFLIVVFWQMPHFYAIALYRINDYRAANIPVLPIAKGIEATKKEMFVYTVAYTLSCFLLAFLGYVGSFYMVTALLLGFAWIVLCLKGFKEKNVDLWARKMFKFSLLVVTILSFIITIDVSS